MGDDLAAKREEERLMRAFGGAKSPRVVVGKPAATAAASPAPAAVKPAATVAAPSVTVAAKPAAASATVTAGTPASTIPARPGPAFPKGKPAAVVVSATAPPTLKQGALETGQVAPTNLGGGGNVYTSAKIPTLRGRKDVQRGVQIWQGKMLEDESKLRLAQDGGYTGLEQLLQHNALDVRNLAKEAVLQLETAPGTGDIGTFTAEKLSPLVKLFTTTDNILVRQLALWDLATMASVPESRKAIIDKFGLDVVVKLVTDPETEIAAAATTLLGNLAQDDAHREAIFKESALAHVLALGKDRKDPKAICAVSFAVGNFSLDEDHARRVVQAGGLAWVLQQLTSGDPEILRTAWGAISTLAKYDFARQEILNANGLKSLVHILKTTKDDLTFQYATQAVVNLCLDGAIAERFIHETGLLALERVNDDSFDLLCTKNGLVKRPTPSVYAVQLRVATSYRNIAKANMKCRDLLRARQDSVAIVRSLARSDQEKIAVVAKEALTLLEGDADAKAREAEARLRAEAEEARKKLAAEEEQRRVKAQLAEEERKRAVAAEEESKRKAAEAELARKRAADAEEARKKAAAAEEEARQKAAADEAARKRAAAEEESRRKLAEEERRRKEEAEAREAKLKADLEAERKRLELERKEAYEKERKAREEAEARARQLEEDRRRKEDELRARLDKEDQERREKWRKEEEERRRADEEARRRTEEDMRKLEDMQRRLADERRRLDDAKRALDSQPAQIVVKERGAAELPVQLEPVKVQSPKKEEEKKPEKYQIDRIIAEMLEKLDLSRYETNFAHNKITYDGLFSLRDHDLRDMGIDAVGPRARILQAINELYADSLGQKGDAAMRRLIDDLDAKDPNVVSDSLERLFIVAERGTANRNALIVLGLIPILIALIRKSRYIEIQSGAAKVLASVAQETRAQAEIRNAKGIEPVVYLANYESWKEDLETLAFVLLLLKRLTNDTENKRLLREQNFMPQIIHIIAKDEQPAVRALALDVLSAITVEDSANQEALWNTNMSLNYINSAFESNDVEVKEAATRAIGALAGGPFVPFQQLIWGVPFNIPAKLIKLCSLDGEETLQAAATLALSYISEDNLQHTIHVITQGVLRRTSVLLRAKNQNARIAAAAALRVLARGPRVRTSVAHAATEACLIGPLCELAAFSPLQDVRREALGAVFELSKESRTVQKLVYASLGPKPLITGLKSGIPVVQYYSGGIFYNAARNRSDVLYEMNTAGVEPLVRSLLASTDFNLRLGAEALDDMLRNVTSPGPVTASALAQ